MQIKLNFSKKQILARVKSVTYQKGQVDIAANANKSEAFKLGYQEQAGDDQPSEFLLLSYLRRGVDAFKALLVEYVVPEDSSTPTLAADNISDNLSSETEDVFTIFLNVSDRFNTAMTDVLADYGSAFIESQMLYNWYRPFDLNTAKSFLDSATDIIASIQRCFIKGRPSIPTYAYPASITIDYPVIRTRNEISGFSASTERAVLHTLYDNPLYLTLGELTKITYSIQGEDDRVMPVDDIAVRVDNDCCRPMMQDGNYCIRAEQEGACIVTLFSRHDSSVCQSFAVKVSPNCNV